MTLSVSMIIWCWWQIRKWLWCICRLILATDSWSTETDLSHWHSTTINTRQTDQRMNLGLGMERLVADCLCLLIWVLIILLALRKNHKSCLGTQKLIPKVNRQLSYLRLNCILSILGECIFAIMYNTIIVIRHSKTGDYVCVIFIKIGFHPCWRTDKLHCIFTEPHTNTIVPLWLLKV